MELPSRFGNQPVSSERDTSRLVGSLAHASKSSLNPSASIKSVFEDYISKHSLVNTQDYRTIFLDEELGRAAGVKNPVGERMAREEVLKRLRAGVAWSVSIDGVLKCVKMTTRVLED